MAATYLHRTPSTAATNTKKATFSWWTKTTGISIKEGHRIVEMQNGSIR